MLASFDDFQPRSLTQTASHALSSQERAPETDATSFPIQVVLRALSSSAKRLQGIQLADTLALEGSLTQRTSAIN